MVTTDICVLLRPLNNSAMCLNLISTGLNELRSTDEIYKAISKFHPALPSLISVHRLTSALNFTWSLSLWSHCFHYAVYTCPKLPGAGYSFPLPIGKCWKEGKEIIPIIENRAGHPCHWLHPFKRWKVSIAKRLGDMSGYKFSKHVYFGWLDDINYRFESQLQIEDVIRR